LYTRAALAVLLLPPPPHDIKKPVSDSTTAVSSTASARFRLSVNGAPSSTANTIAPPLFHGTAGAWLAALVVVVIVKVVTAVPFAIETELELKVAVTLAELLLATRPTVPV
jgi:hypothetical protein